MAQVLNKFSKVTVRQRKGTTGVMTGANTEVLINGVPLKGAQGVKFEVQAKGIAQIRIDLLGEVEVEGNLDEVSEYEGEYELGDYAPKRLVPKKEKTGEV